MLEPVAKGPIVHEIPYTSGVCHINKQYVPGGIYTHYYNSNLIWRTVSRRVEEVIPSDHTRREDSSKVVSFIGI